MNGKTREEMNREAVQSFEEHYKVVGEPRRNFFKLQLQSNMVIIGLTLVFLILYLFY